MRDRLEHVHERGFREVLLLAHDPRGHAFPIDRKRNEDGFALHARDAAAAEGNVFDLELDCAHAE